MSERSFTNMKEPPTPKYDDSKLGLILFNEGKFYLRYWHHSEYERLQPYAVWSKRFDGDVCEHFFSSYNGAVEWIRNQR